MRVSIPMLLFLATLTAHGQGLHSQPFMQEVPTFHRIGEELPATTPDGEELVKVSAVVLSQEGKVLASGLTADGNAELLEWDGESWQFLVPLTDYIGASPQHGLVMGLSGVASLQEAGRIVAADIFPENGGGLVATEDEVWQRWGEADPENRLVFKSQGPILAVAAGINGAAAIGTENGLFYRSSLDSPFLAVYPADENYSWAPRQVAAVAFDTRGRFWFGSQEGVGRLDGETWTLFTGEEGLPYNHFTCAAPGENGVIWFGTERGAIRYDGSRFDYRASGRWLADDRVSSIAVAKDGTAWIATETGVSRIARVPMTLDEKAAFYQERTEKVHNRMGYITDRTLTRRGDVTSAVEKITDNDGQYTAWYGMAFACKYALTGDPADKAIAKRCFEACKLLVDIVPESMKGFPARVLIPADWHEPVNEQYGPEYNLRKQEDDPFWKLITPRFPLSEDGLYRWKNDTSSDELCGHYILYDMYYDLVAETEEEKEPVRQVVRDITDHLMKNDYNLIDHDGTPTRWARFGPEYIYSHTGWEQRGLNSLMLLSFLAVAEHITGDEKYARAAQDLRENHEYLINILEPRPYFPPENVVPWDNSFVTMCFYLLMKHDLDPERQILYRMGLENGWLFISRQKNALWNFLYGGAAQRFENLAEEGYFNGAFPDSGPFAEHRVAKVKEFDCDVEGNLEWLRTMPLDLIAWDMRNSHRLDFEQDPTPGQEPGYGWSKVDRKAFPMAERGHVRLDRDCFFADYQEGGEGDGYSLHEGTLFLLPYYLGRYHGFID